MALVRTTRDFEDVLLPLLPATFRSEREDWLLRLLAPHFVRSFDIVGDVCVFGCRSGLPGPLAFVLGALGVPKTVYAFDEFGDEHAAGWETGRLGAGEYFADLGRWSAVIPVRAIRGSVAETCKLLIERVAFIFFDMDDAGVFDSVLDNLGSLLGANTVIGVNGIGRPERADLTALLDQRLSDGKLVTVIHHPENSIAFYRPTIAR